MSRPTLTPPEAARRAQFRSRERVRDFAEVYTDEREVHAMLGLVPGMFPSETDPGNTDRTFLEPACGDGNFLVKILGRKLQFVTPQRYESGECFEHRILRCLSSTYGIDISADNVAEARRRLRATIAAHLEMHGATATSVGFGEALDAILATNVICADTLAQAAEIELVAYEPGTDGTFIREWCRPLDPDAGAPSLFTLAPRRDEVPVHYSELADQVRPSIAEPVSREAA